MAIKIAGVTVIDDSEQATFAALTVDGTSLLDGPVVINGSGLDADFRVEGNTDTNLISTDAGNDRVYIGTAATGGQKLNVGGNMEIDGNIISSTNWYLYSDASGSGVRSGINFDGTNQAIYLLTGGSEKWRVSSEPRAESSLGTKSTMNQWSSFTTLASEQFIAQSTGILITGDLNFSGAGLAMYVYSRVKLIVTGGADVAVGYTQIDGLGTSAPFDYVSQSPSLAVTGLTVGGDYTVVLEVAKGNAAAVSAQGRVNYIH